MGITDVSHKNVFGMRGLMRGKKMFAAVGEEEIIVKLTPAESLGCTVSSWVQQEFVFTMKSGPTIP